MGGNPLLAGADQLDPFAREWPTQSRLGKQAGYSQGLPCVRRGVRIPPYPTVWGDALAESMGCTLYARFAVVNRESNNNLRIDNRETSRYDSQL